MYLRSGILVLFLASCTTSGGEAQKARGYELRAGGIGVPGSSLEISFDRVNPGATRALEKLAGPVTSRKACANGGELITFRDGLSAVFLDRAFAGWLADGRRAGMGCA